MVIRAAVLIMCLGAMAPASAAASAAGAYQRVLHAYERSGSIPPCQFSGAELESALGGVDTYGAQYFADFTEAVQAALTARAGGECSASAAPVPAAAGPASNAVAALPAVTAATSAGVPAPLIVLAILAAGLAVARVVTGRRSR
jgi:hypothetical protein